MFVHSKAPIYREDDFFFWFYVHQNWQVTSDDQHFVMVAVSRRHLYYWYLYEKLNTQLIKHTQINNVRSSVKATAVEPTHIIQLTLNSC
jgi:hypothetical protein